ncbi:hypothetical protein GIB67_020676 [Kingdonia uniflora]|uniref:Uncharacterized protein n=1 Tax=Kingdonia uniflora TaxID=39325 RepID=A0A7J7NK46_9MAGN|nr:hypothetical protein GIB67_020676 [Kingdonia uniflora]
MMAEERGRRDNRTRYSINHDEGQRKDVPTRKEDADMRVKNLKPSCKIVVSSSDDSSSSGRTIDDAEVRGTVTVDMPVVVQFGVNERLEEEVEAGDFFNYPADAAIGKMFSKYKKDLDGKWGHYGVMNALECCPAQLNGNVFEMMRVCEALNKKWRGGDSARQFVVDDVLKYYKLKYMKGRKSGYLYSDSVRPKFFDFESVRRPWYYHLVMVRGNCMQVPGEPALEMLYKNFSEKPNPKGVADTSSLFDVVSREGTDLNQVLGELGIRREKRLNSVVLKVQRAHQNRAMATSGSAYDDIMEIPACTAGTSSIQPRRRRGKKALPLPEQTTLAQMTQAETEVDAAGVNLKAVEQKALDLAKHDPIRLDTQIRSSISQLSVAWKSGVEVLKVAAADRAEYEAEKTSLAEYVVTARNSLVQAFYFWGLKREDVNPAIAGKYGEIIFPEEDPSSVAERPPEQTPTPPAADDTTPEEVVCLREKVIEMEKTLSRARDSINRTQQVHNKLEYERCLHKLNFDNTFKELFELKCRYGTIKIERDEVLRKESDRFVLLQKSLKDKRFVDESDKLECQRSLLSLMLYFEAEVDIDRGLKEAYLELLTEIGIVPDPARVKFLAQEARNCYSVEAQRCSAWDGSRLNAVTVELSCKDAKILTANNEAKLWKKSLKKKKLETMAANQQVLDLLSTIEKQKNDLLYHQSVVTNNTDLLKKQDAEIRHMRERLKKLNWDLCEARNSYQRKIDHAKNRVKACSKRDRKLNETINKCNTRITDLEREKQSLALECLQGNTVYEELHLKCEELQRLVNAADNERKHSKEEKKSLVDRCKDLDNELNKVKAKFCEATLLTADNVTLRAMAMLHADIEKFRTERDSILAASTEYAMEYDMQLARLSYIDNLMPRVMELLNAPSTVVDAAIPFPALLSSGPRESSNVVRPKRER